MECSPCETTNSCYSGTHTVYMVNNTQEKQVYYKHELIARGTVIMTAEGETERLYEEVFPLPQQVNGVRQGRASCCQPPKKVDPGTPLSGDGQYEQSYPDGDPRLQMRPLGRSHRLCGTLHHQTGTRYKGRKANDQATHSSTGRNPKEATGRLDSRHYYCPLG